MTALFWLALMLGGGLALLSVAGDFLNTDDHFHTGMDSDAWHILSLRSATYFLFSFGAVGLLSRMAGAGMLLAAVAAAVTGIGAAAAATAVFRYVQGTETGGFPTDDSFVGLTGMVVMPVVHGGTVRSWCDGPAGTLS
jgi:hypothetical protein